MNARRGLMLLLLNTACMAQSAVSPKSRTQNAGRIPPPFSLNGLDSHAQVSGTIFVSANAPLTTLSVTYYLDDHLQHTETHFPFWFGGQTDTEPLGNSLGAASSGPHRLRAVASLPGGLTIPSQVLLFSVVPSINSRFSTRLTPYANQRSAQQQSLQQILNATTTPGAILTPTEIDTRRNVLSMYRNWGIDPSLDNRNDQSKLLLALAPTGWAVPAPAASTTPLSLLFSPDAPFYQAIPSLWPRVALPSGYFKKLQLNTTQKGDGIGFGESVAGPNDPPLPVHSQWYSNLASRNIFSFPIAPDWFHSLPEQPAGDMHMVFVDAARRFFVSSYKTSRNPVTGGPNALFANAPTPFDSLGDRGGSIAAGFADLPILLQPGEATDAEHPIRHALGGSVARTWAARVFPASAWDGDIKTSFNSCSHQGLTNTGLVPYGGVIQLDPRLDLEAMHLTLPALRILQAIQTYGFYVVDFGCTDIDIYTAISEAELDPFGGLWGYNKRGPGVQNEVEKVLLNNRLSVVVPLTKKQ